MAEADESGGASGASPSGPKGNDITRSVIPDREFRDHIGFMFPDSVVLDVRFNFVCISQNILDALGYTRGELQGESVSILSDTMEFQNWLRRTLRAGYFEEHRVELRTKKKGHLLFGISGFYLGLIIDINGLIVLRLRNMEEINLMYNRLEAKTVELDRFVYRSAHALRGPLATIKGLINLGLLSRPEELNFLIQRMQLFAEELDDKLHRLIYFAESDKDYEWTFEGRSLEAICDSLSSRISAACMDKTIHFICLNRDLRPVLDNGVMVLSLLRNLCLFFCHQSRKHDGELLLDFEIQGGDAVTITLFTRGFLFDTDLHEKIRAGNFGYAEILNDAEMINCYAAKKIAFKLRGTIEFSTIITTEMKVVASLPCKVTRPGIGQA